MLSNEARNAHTYMHTNFYRQAEIISGRIHVMFNLNICNVIQSKQVLQKIAVPRRRRFDQPVIVMNIRQQ